MNSLCFVNADCFQVATGMDKDTAPDHWTSGDVNEAMTTTNSSSDPPPTGPTPYCITGIVILTLVFLLGSVGNFSVIWILSYKIKKTTITIFFLNLAIADFVLVMTLPASMAYILSGFVFPDDTIFCKIISFLLFTNMYASVFFLTVISVDRYFAVVYPVKALRYRSKHVASRTACAIWIFALLINIPAVHFRDGDSVKDSKGSILCDIDLSRNNTDNTSKITRITTINVIRTVLGFIIPFGVMLFCYCRIALKIRSTRLVRKGKPLRVIMTVVAAFFVCWAPYYVVNLIEVASHHTKKKSLNDDSTELFVVTESIAFVSCCINPILFVFSGQDIKDRFRNSLLQVMENALNELMGDRLSSEKRTDWWGASLRVGMGRKRGECLGNSLPSPHSGIALGSLSFILTLPPALLHCPFSGIAEVLVARGAITFDF
uniref:Complement C5a receptor 1 n=1 Tax=Eptatretus burgeri TaxID=7764 RepID=A0A8C4NLM8_EPTBU